MVEPRKLLEFLRVCCVLGRVIRVIRVVRVVRVIRVIRVISVIKVIRVRVIHSCTIK